MTDPVSGEDGGFFMTEARSIHPAGKPVCGARKKVCRACEHRFPKEEYDLLYCPECGEQRRCLEVVSQPGKRCRHHGGASLKGIAQPSFRTGSYSRYMPERLVEHYVEALGDPDLLALRSEIALMDTRLMDLLKRVDSGEAGRHWKTLKQTWTEFDRGRRRKDGEGMAVALDNLERLIESGHSDYAAWAEIGTVVEARRKLVESERRRLVDLQQMITTERAVNLFAAFQGILIEHVTDKKVLNAIGEDIRILLDRPGS